MRATGEPFGQEEDAFIRANSGTMLHRDIAARLGRSERAVQCRARKLGLRRFPTTPFSPAEDEAIRAGISRSSVDVARELGRAPQVVRARAKRIGLGKWKKQYRDSKGYKVVAIDREGGGSRRVPEHRVIVEGHLGRRLTSDERVHHINLDKRDNRIDNLFLCRNTSAHSIAHHSINGIVADLLDRGIIEFDRVGGVYRLCETHK